VKTYSLRFDTAAQDSNLDFLNCTPIKMSQLLLKSQSYY